MSLAAVGLQFPYFLLAFFSTLTGAMAGIGGGVIIKPVLDVLNIDGLGTISILSSATVFAMAAVSTVQQLRSGFIPDRRMLVLAAGAAAGGIAGGRLFDFISQQVNQDILKAAQAAILALLMLVVLIRKKLPDYEVESSAVSSLVGVLLGFLSAFLGIGGGPLNVAVLCMFLAMSVKDAAVISIIIILFSQGAKLASVAAGPGFGIYPDLHKLIYMIPGGVIGGLAGARLNRILSGEFIDRFFTILITCVIALNILNTVKALAG